MAAWPRTSVRGKGGTDATNMQAMKLHDLGTGRLES